MSDPLTTLEHISAADFIRRLLRHLNISDEYEFDPERHYRLWKEGEFHVSTREKPSFTLPAFAPWDWTWGTMRVEFGFRTGGKIVKGDVFKARRQPRIGNLLLGYEVTSRGHRALSSFGGRPRRASIAEEPYRLEPETEYAFEGALDLERRFFWGKVTRLDDEAATEMRGEALSRGRYVKAQRIYFTLGSEGTIGWRFSDLLAQIGQAGPA